MESKEISEINKLFVILDVFSRGSLYRQCIEGSSYCKKDSIDFEQLRKEFENTLKVLLMENGETILREKRMFDNYKDIIVRVLGIDIRYSKVLEESHVEFAKWKKTLLFFATSQSVPEHEDERDALKRIIKILAAESPSTICFSSLTKSESEDIGQGPTPLHLMIVKKTPSKEAKSYKYEILRNMLQESKRKKSLYDLDTVNLDDAVSEGPLFKGKTILNIAARTLDVKIIKMLLNHGVRFDAYNTYKDNMYHSLVRYAMVFPEKEGKIISTMNNIELFLQKNGGELDTIDKHKKGRPESLWKVKNHEHLTPLQLAAKHGRFELFEHILGRRVYSIEESLDDVIFDITEIETIPVDDDQSKDNTERTERNLDTLFSVLFFIGKLKTYALAIRFVSQTIISKTITEKWSKYKFWFYLWMFVHVIIMLLYSWSAIVRSRIGNPPVEQDSSSDVYNNVDQVIGSSTIVLVYGSVCFGVHGISFVVYLYKLLKHKLQKPWSWYFILFILFGLCIIVDYAFLFDTSSYQNFLVPYTIILGWFLLLYFLQVFEMFGFFTALIQHAAIHLLEFGVVLSTLLIGFTLAMFVAMQKAKPHEEEDDFENIGKTFVKMFTIMLGIGEIGVLFSALHPVVSVSIFVMFVLVTTLFLLNALIAVFSNTCTKLTSEVSKKAHVQLQRMLTIIHLEMFLLNRFCVTAGKIIKIRNTGNSKAFLKRRILLARPENEAEEENSRIFRYASELFRLSAKRQGTKKARSKRKISPISTTPPQTIDENLYQNSTIEVVTNSEK